MADISESAPRPGGGTATAPAPGSALLADRLGKRKARTLWSDAWMQYRRHHLAVAGTVVLLAFIIAVIVGPMIYTENAQALDVVNAMQGPSLAHPMGLDDLGHDILARILVGGRRSLTVGIMAMLVAITLGTLVGAVSGFFGGFLDSLLMRFTDLFLALPQLPLLLLIIYLYRDKLKQLFGLETGLMILIIGVIGGFAWMGVARLVRASFLSLKEKEFIEAARCIGASRPSIIFKHILPNSLSPVIVAATIQVGGAIITESSLSFLGLGFPPDVPTWGSMLFNAKDQLPFAPHMALFPGMAIFITVLAINYMGDGLRDALDPHSRR
ncbi:MAG TPA: ABC transporter permease [Thermomicrobiales bacterium]|nr:ABC transporter permease [Thermomicrobiales bacterium]